MSLPGGVASASDRWGGHTKNKHGLACLNTMSPEGLLGGPILAPFTGTGPLNTTNFKVLWSPKYKVEGFPEPIPYDTGVKQKARGPNAAHHAILFGPWRLESHMVTFISCAFILKVSNLMDLCNIREMFMCKILLLWNKQ